jgi:hypothetical protein
MEQKKTDKTKRRFISMTHMTTKQEEFIINILNGKKNGYYVELGAAHYSNGNNTYLLENEYDWTGVSFEIIDSMKEEFNANRKNPCMGDALSFNYMDYFEKNNFPKQIDYLQLDIDAGYDMAGRPVGNSHLTLQGLIAMPLNTYRFSVITFEHDSDMYWRNSKIRDVQREILDSFGYALVQRSYNEDWWVDPTVMQHGYFREYLHWQTL